MKIPVPSITALELHLGKRRQTRLGLGIGAAIGVLRGLQEEVAPRAGFHYHHRADAVLAYAFSYGVLGALAGSLVRTDRWATVNISTITRQGRPGYSSLELAAAVRF